MSTAPAAGPSTPAAPSAAAPAAPSAAAPAVPSFAAPAAPGAAAPGAEAAAVVLARWVAGLRFADLPPDVVDAALRHLVDAVGCAVAGIRRGAAGPALAVASGLGGPPEARLFTGERLGAVAAAFGNAVAVHALDFDDTHPGGLVHASAVTVPVVLALPVSSQDELITALVSGLETICRLGAAAPHGFHGKGLHATSICGPVAAAVVAGKLLGLSERQLTDAIGIAASGASGLLEFLHSPASTKQLHPGTAVANGILAARLAAAGATGPAGALDGTYGLYRALADRDPDRGVLLGDLGTRWETTGIAIKPYPCCQLTHAALDAARTFTSVRNTEPVEVTVVLHPDAIPIVAGPEKRAPRSAYEAKFSVYYCVAAMIVDGRVDLDTFDDLDRPGVLELAGRIAVVAGPATGVPADAPGDVTVDGHRAVVGHAAGPGVRTKAAANLGPHAQAVFDAVDARAGAATLLDAIEGCLK